jgi:hypothetical protein
MARDAGFTHFKKLDVDHSVNAFYEVRPEGNTSTLSFSSLDRVTGKRAKTILFKLLVLAAE